MAPSALLREKAVKGREKMSRDLLRKEQRINQQRWKNKNNWHLHKMRIYTDAKPVHTGLVRSHQALAVVEVGLNFIYQNQKYSVSVMS